MVEYLFVKVAAPIIVWVLGPNVAKAVVPVVMVTGGVLGLFFVCDWFNDWLRGN